MEENKKELIGSPNRDLWRRLHKNGDNTFYGLDIDFVFVEKKPVPHIVAFIDVKNPDDTYTFVEVLVYNILMKIAPVYMVVMRNVNVGEFDVRLYEGGDFHPFPPIANDSLVLHTKTWDEFFTWEAELRK